MIKKIKKHINLLVVSLLCMVLLGAIAVGCAGNNGNGLGNGGNDEGDATNPQYGLVSLNINGNGGAIEVYANDILINPGDAVKVGDKVDIVVALQDGYKYTSDADFFFSTDDTKTYLNHRYTIENIQEDTEINVTFDRSDLKWVHNELIAAHITSIDLGSWLGATADNWLWLRYVAIRHHIENILAGDATTEEETTKLYNETIAMLKIWTFYKTWNRVGAWLGGRVEENYEEIFWEANLSYLWQGEQYINNNKDHFENTSYEANLKMNNDMRYVENRLDTMGYKVNQQPLLRLLDSTSGYYELGDLTHEDEYAAYNGAVRHLNQHRWTAINVTLWEIGSTQEDYDNIYAELLEAYNNLLDIIDAQ